MKRKILTAVAVVALGVPLAPAAFARDWGHEHGGRYERPDRDEWRYRDGRRRGGFVVRYHLDGPRRVHAKSHDRAERIEDFLRSVGADAAVGRNGHVVRYRMRGEGRTVRYDREDAHRLAQKLAGYGFHVDVARR